MLSAQNQKESPDLKHLVSATIEQQAPLLLDYPEEVDVENPDEPNVVASDAASLNADPADSETNLNADPEQKEELPKFNRARLLAAFIIYFGSDSCWQAADDALGNEAFLKNRGQWLALFYLARYLATGGAQAFGGSVSTVLLYYCNISNYWGRWEIANSLFQGVIFQALVDLGTFLGGGLTMEGNPFTPARLATSSTTLVLGTFASLAVSRKLKRCLRGPMTEADEKKEQEDERKNNNTFLDTTETVTAGAFYAQAPVPEIGSPSGHHNIWWAGLFSGLAGTAFETIRETWAYCRPRCGRRPAEE